MAASRLIITQVIREIIRDISHQMPEFAHIRASQILVVAGEARRASRATVRPMRFGVTKSRQSKDGSRRKPLVRFKGHQILYTVTLRPMFFLQSSPAQRVETILHELFHVSKRFDGTLHSGRRHHKLGPEFERRLRPLVRRYLKLIPSPLLDALAFDGEVLARQWLERPGAAQEMVGKGGVRRHAGRRLYDERQLFLGPVRMVTPPAYRIDRGPLH